MDDRPLISVIVPVYNVEPFVGKCLDSLSSQTMEQIEVICVDDGSTDSGGAIADEYCRNPRFKVIHRTNGGLSAARNTGIELAAGEWLMFVDGDDWVESRYCELPYREAQACDADAVIFGAHIWKNGEEVNKNNTMSHGMITVPNGITDELTAHEQGWVWAWNKLFKRTLFDGIRYPEHKVYEDFATTHLLLHRSKRIAVVQERLYHHIRRQGSIATTRSVENKRDGYRHAKERFDSLVSWSYPREKLVPFLCTCALGLLCVEQRDGDALYESAASFLDSVQGIPGDLPLKHKAALFAWKRSRKLFHLLFTPKK